MTFLSLAKAPSRAKVVFTAIVLSFATGPLLALDTPDSFSDALETNVTDTPMHSGHQITQTLPKPRPDPALSYGMQPVTITLPHVKPALEDVLPISTRTLASTILAQTGLDTLKEVQYTLRAGEGVSSILRRAGYTNADAFAAVEAAKTKAGLRRLRIGMNFTIAENGFRFSVKPGIDIYILKHPDSGWLGLNALRPLETYVAFIQGTVDDSIYRAAKNAGVDESAFNEYVRVMGHSVDFQREIRRGDHFEMMYNIKRDVISGDMIEIRLQYAGLELSGDQLGFFRFDNADGKTGWYDENGNSASRTLIRTPISGARLSSNFGSRKHPISGYTAMHKGVDFAAPLGTPIIAAGSGVVQEAKWKGGFGRYIRIKHNATYETAYAHLSRLASNIFPGTRVKQGEVIGYVGSTGRSTGPHLHYEILVNNRQVNPMTVRLPTGEQIDQAHIEDFKNQVNVVEAEIIARGTLRFATALPSVTKP